MSEPTQESPHDQEWANERFDPGERPSDEVVVDETADDTPNVGHPK